MTSAALLTWMPQPEIHYHKAGDGSHDNPPRRTLGGLNFVIDQPGAAVRTSFRFLINRQPAVRAEKVGIIVIGIGILVVVEFLPVAIARRHAPPGPSHRAGLSYHSENKRGLTPPSITAEAATRRE